MRTKISTKIPEICWGRDLSSVAGAGIKNKTGARAGIKCPIPALTGAGISVDHCISQHRHQNTDHLHACHWHHTLFKRNWLVLPTIFTSPLLYRSCNQITTNPRSCFFYQNTKLWNISFLLNIWITLLQCFIFKIFKKMLNHLIIFFVNSYTVICKISWMIYVLINIYIFWTFKSCYFML